MEEKYKDFLKKFNEKKISNSLHKTNSLDNLNNVNKFNSEPSSPKSNFSSPKSTRSEVITTKLIKSNNVNSNNLSNNNIKQLNQINNTSQNTNLNQINQNNLFNEFNVEIKNNINSYYDENWKELDTVLLYQSPDFKFNSNIVIVELDNTLIKNISKKKLYENQFDENNKTIELYLDNTMRKFKSNEFSVIIMSNQISKNDNNYDIIKLKIKKFIEKTHIPILAFFALRPNYFMKPHTKLWILLKQYYKLRNKEIKTSMVISNNGGIFLEKYHKKTDTITGKFISDDIDRAFANNIGLPFISIENFLEITNNKSKLKWTSSIIPPELRIELIEELKYYKNKDIFNQLANLGELGKNYDTYLIIVFGAPCSGKTTLSREIIKKWRSSKLNENKAIKFYSNNKYSINKINNLTKKALENRISVLVDGEYPNNNYRKFIIDVAKKNNSGILYIEVNPDFEMSKLLNHVRVETSNDFKKELIALSKFYEYRGKYIKPVTDKNSSYILYKPNLIPTNILTKYRF